MIININFKTKEITYDNPRAVYNIARILKEHWLVEWKLKLTKPDAQPVNA